MLAGSLGALFVFLLNVLTDHVRGRRELRGIARLVDIEMRQNRLTLESLYRNPSLVLTSTISTIRLDTWEATRVHMAGMIPSRDFGSLAFYYFYLQELKHLGIARHQFSDPVALTGDLLTVIRVQDGDAAKAALKYSNIKTFVRISRWQHRISPQPR